MGLVRYEKVSKRFGRVRVIQGVNLEIEDGELVVFVGPSGCGKTTLLRLIAGLEEVSEGELYIGDRRVTRMPPKERNVAMVFQNYALYPHMTVAQNIAFGLKLRGASKKEQEEAVNRAAKMLGLSDLLKRRPRELSGGQRQRVAMGRAIVRDPAVFLMDEPLSNLDAKLRNHMRVEIKQLQRQLRTTMIYVTHDQVEAMTLAHRIAVIHEGKVSQFGTPDELYARPADGFVAGFIGTPSMNFIPAERKGETELQLPGGFVVPWSAERMAALEPSESAYMLGIRPEHMEVLSEPPQVAPGRFHWSSQVDLCEPLGGEVLVHTSLGGQPVRFMVPRRLGVEEGAPIHMAFRISLAHLFAADGGRCVSHARES